MFDKLKNFFSKNSKDIIIVLILLVISGLAHSVNMFNFPYYENDEGVYMSQAWSLIKFGELAPYTYWYDHAPAGWIFIAAWNLLTGGFFTFGFSLNSGRVFMLVLHLLSSVLLYMMAIKLTKSRLAAITSVAIFSLSPLGIYFQRRVLLDNIMVFWTLLSLTFILFYNYKLRSIVLSGLAFGIALLTKETAIIFTPLYLYLIYCLAHTHHRLFAIVKWIAVVGVMVGFYFIFALLKGELFPSSSFLGGGTEHVSLIEALQFQAGRKGGSIFEADSSFWTNFWVWVGEDPFIMYAGAGATILNLIIGIKNFPSRVVGIFSALFWFFLMRGGLVIEFYVIPHVPILALNIALVGWNLHRLVSKYFRPVIIKKAAVIPALAILLVSIGVSLINATTVRNTLNIFTSDQTTPQKEAIDWILAQETPNTIFVIDNYGYIDLQEKKKNPSFKTEWYWKVDRDPEIRDELLKGDKNNIDYVALTPQMKNDIAYSGLGLTLAGWRNSLPVTIFSKDFWDVDIWGSINSNRVLKYSWESYKKEFIVEGRVIDPSIQDATTSEGQSYALLRAVYMNDKKSFNEIYKWSQKYLQQGSGIFYWKWEGSKKGKVVDHGNATDADQDIALSLLFAYKKWGDESYLKEAKNILDGLWENNVVTIEGKPYIMAGNWANHRDSLTINPSYLSPVHYKIFSEVDLSHPWYLLVDTSYEVLEQCTLAPLDKKTGVLPPEWCSLDTKSLKVSQPTEPKPTASEYSYNAFRTPWRIALDHFWFNDPRAKNYLSKLDFLQKEWNSNHKLVAAYTHDGQIWENYESVAAYGANMGYFKVMNPEVAKQIYEEKIFKKFYEERNTSYWDDPKNYYSQNWAWFGTALYYDKLPNLWALH